MHLILRYEDEFIFSPGPRHAGRVTGRRSLHRQKIQRIDIDSQFYLRNRENSSFCENEAKDDIDYL